MLQRGDSYDQLALAISPSSKTLSVSTLTLVQQGVPPYAFTLVSGNGTITSAGNYTAPTTSTNAVVRVTDSSGGTVDATVTVNGALAISPASILIAAGGTQAFVASVGVSPYVYTVVSGGGSFSSTTYTAPATASGASVSIMVTDALGNTANAAITMNPITVTIGSPNNSDLITASNKAAFPASGTCSESGRTVNVSTTGGDSDTNLFRWDLVHHLKFTSVNDGPVTITAAHSNVNSVAATSAT